MITYTCPSCGSSELRVEVTQWAFLRQKVDHLPRALPPTVDPQWSDTSRAQCVKCRHQGELWEFHSDD